MTWTIQASGAIYVLAAVADVTTESRLQGRLAIGTLKQPCWRTSLQFQQLPTWQTSCKGSVSSTSSFAAHLCQNRTLPNPRIRTWGRGEQVNARALGGLCHSFGKLCLEERARLFVHFLFRWL